MDCANGATCLIAKKAKAMQVAINKKCLDCRKPLKGDICFAEWCELYKFTTYKHECQMTNEAPMKPAPAMTPGCCDAGN